MENIDIDIDIDKDNLKNIDIDIDIDMAILKNIDIDKGILQNIDIDEISYRLGFGISNTPSHSLSIAIQDTGKLTSIFVALRMFTFWTVVSFEENMLKACPNDHREGEICTICSQTRELSGRITLWPRNGCSPRQVDQ